MIRRLRGELVGRGASAVEVVTGDGVGYEVNVPLGLVDRLPPEGAAVELHTVLVVRDDAFELYGFETARDRELFQRLRTPSGVGPRLALAILGALPPGRIVRAIRAKDHRTLQTVSGVGRKTAERIAIDLADKLDDLGDPAGDLPAVVLALGAQLTTSSAGGHRTIGADDFFVDLLTTALRPDEILSEITIPAPAQGTGSAYAKFANKASHFAVVGVAASVTVGSDGSCREVRIGVTGAGPKAVRATEAEAALRGSKPDDDAIRSAAERAGSGIDFNEDVHASGEYRAHLTTVYTERALKAAVSRAG